ncbi:MAG: hypothetical protein J7K98_01745, partial [Candidatus Aenigmarchaeota archaeon]|nr:hypothetical protein [Candidatus Aenigmarchaeota archaeon]
LTILCLFSLFLVAMWDECPHGNIVKAINSIGNSQKILELCYGSYAKVWKWVRENVKENEVVATTDFRLYYYNKTVIEFTSWKLRNLFHTTDPHEWEQIFKSNGVKYVVITQPATTKYVEHFGKLVKKIDEKQIYRIK